jgi:hypothetical protein
LSNCAELAEKAYSVMQRVTSAWAQATINIRRTGTAIS